MDYDFIAFTDGSAVQSGEYLYNGGSACVVLDRRDKEVHTKGKSLPDRSNNYAELYAALIALEVVAKIKKKNGMKNAVDVLIISDSKYVVDTFEEWVYSWSEGKSGKDTWTRKGGKLLNEKLIKHIYYKYICNKDFNVSFIHMNAHKTTSDTHIKEMVRKVGAQGYHINRDVAEVFIKYNRIADKISYEHSSTAAYV